MNWSPGAVGQIWLTIMTILSLAPLAVTVAEPTYLFVPQAPPAWIELNELPGWIVAVSLAGL